MASSRILAASMSVTRATTASSRTQGMWQSAQQDTTKRSKSIFGRANHPMLMLLIEKHSWRDGIGTSSGGQQVFFRPVWLRMKAAMACRSYCSIYGTFMPMSFKRLIDLPSRSRRPMRPALVPALRPNCYGIRWRIRTQGRWRLSRICGAFVLETWQWMQMYLAPATLSPLTAGLRRRSR